MIWCHNSSYRKLISYLIWNVSSAPTSHRCFLWPLHNLDNNMYSSFGGLTGHIPLSLEIFTDYSYFHWYELKRMYFNRNILTAKHISFARNRFDHVVSGVIPSGSAFYPSDQLFQMTTFVLGFLRALMKLKGTRKRKT